MPPTKTKPNTRSWANARAARMANREARAAARNASRAAPTDTTPPITDAIAVYRAEKLAGESRRKAKLEEARAMLDRLNADLETTAGR